MLMIYTYFLQLISSVDSASVIPVPVSSVSVALAGLVWSSPSRLLLSVFKTLVLHYNANELAAIPLLCAAEHV